MKSVLLWHIQRLKNKTYNMFIDDFLFVIKEDMLNMSFMLHFMSMLQQNC